MNAIEMIDSFGSPVTSYIRAVQFFVEEQYNLSKEECEQRIAQLIGLSTPPTYSNTKEAFIVFLYVVQETIRASIQGQDLDMSVIWNDVISRSTKFIENNPWSIKDYSIDEENTSTENQGETTSEPTATDTAPKMKKGQKQIKGLALYHKLNDGVNTRNFIIEQLMDQLKMSKPGATTYFHNFKDQFGYKGPKGAGRGRKPTPKDPSAPAPVIPTPSQINSTKKVGKGVKAVQIYLEMKGSPKADIIARIIQETGTTPQGANTYFCKAQKDYS